MATDDEDTPPRSLWQFSFRTLLLLVGLVAMAIILGVSFVPRENRPDIPAGTPKQLEQAILDAYETPITEAMATRPGWAYVGSTVPMKRIASFGDQAIPVLIANIDNEKLELQVIQLLGDLHAKESVPVLLDRLHMEDSFHDSLIIAQLAKITDHPSGYGFYRGWFSEDVQNRAVSEYKIWWQKNKHQVSNNST